MAQAVPASPFFSQIKILEQKLRAAQQEGIGLFGAASPGGDAASPYEYGGQLAVQSMAEPTGVDLNREAEEAVQEATRLREQMQRDIAARASQNAREHEVSACTRSEPPTGNHQRPPANPRILTVRHACAQSLAHRAAALDMSLRASEAARKRDQYLRENEMSDMRQQLDAERTRRTVEPVIVHARSPPGAGRQPVYHSAHSPPYDAPPGETPRLVDREWRLRAELSEATNEAHAARLAAQAAQEEQQRVTSELSARAASATQGVLKLQEEVRSSTLARGVSHTRATASATPRHVTTVASRRRPTLPYRRTLTHTA